MNRYKKHIALMLSFCLVAPLLLTMVSYGIRKEQIRESVKHMLIKGVEPGELVAHTFHKDSVDGLLHWEHESEFEYKGQSYDVVSFEVKGDSITYQTWWDKAETKLNKTLHQEIAKALNTSPEQQNEQQTLTRLFKSMFNVKADFEVKSTTYIAIVDYKNPTNQALLNSLFPEVDSPPPEA